MLKTFKKIVLAVVLILVGVLAFACKECEECEECEECTELNEESCAEFCPEVDECSPAANEENCEEYCEDPVVCPDPVVCQFIAPTSFSIFDDSITVGQSTVNEVYTVTPAKAYKGVYWSSSDPSIATVDADGTITGIRPGTVEITATSVLNPNVSETVEIIVNDELRGYELCNRELKAIIAALPMLADKSFEFPKPWNPNVTVEIKEGSTAVTSFVIPTNLTQDVKRIFSISVKYGSDEAKNDAVTIWAVKDVNDNAIVRVDQASEVANILLKDYTTGGVSSDITLPTTIWGVTLSWSTTNSSVLTSAGVYTRPLDNKSVTLSAVVKYSDNSANLTYKVSVKGYTADEKVDYILTKGSLANFNGGSFNTSLILPTVDSVFKAELSYESDKPEIFDNTGKLIAAPTAKTEVTFTVTVKYAVSTSANNFTKTTTFKVNALPANTASAAAEAWLQASNLNQVAQFSWGKVTGNILDVPTTYTKDEKNYNVTWDVSKAKLMARVPAAEVNAFELVGGKPKLVVQYLRYTEVQIQGTFASEDGSETAKVNLVLNIGVQADQLTVLTGTWRASAQGDTSLTNVQGRYDITSNISYFDRPVGNIVDSFGGGYWSGYSLTTDYEGITYQALIMEQMTAFIRKGTDGKFSIDAANIRDGNGGNWGIFFVNTTDATVKMEVGTYASGTYKDSEELITASGLRENATTLDGYANGFVADKDGNILIGGLGKFQNNMTKQVVEVGSAEASNLVGASPKGTTVHYVEIPAGGYAISWKYQFYFAVTYIDPYLAATKINIDKYDVHPLSSQYAETSTTNVVNAEKNIATANAKVKDEDKISTNKTIETAVITARTLYGKLSGDTKVEVYPLDRLEAIETATALLIDLEIELILEDVANDVEGCTVKVGALYDRLQKYTPELLAKLTKKAAFDAKYAELAAIELTVTLDYQGGYAVGLYSAYDKDLLLDEFMNDLYAFLVSKNAFQSLVETAPTPTLAEFKTVKYWSDNFYKADGHTVLSKYLFTTYSENNENFMKVIEGSDKFINQPEYNKWVHLLDYVDEATRYANGSGQDLWGRVGLNYPALKWLPLQPYYVAGSMFKDQTTVKGTNSSAYIGSSRFCQWITGGLNTNYQNYIPHNVYSSTFDRQITQERFAEITYHCTDGAVKLPEAAYKQGYAFDGWYLDPECTKAAEITGATFKDLTVYAKWVIEYEKPIEELLDKELTTIYYSSNSTNVSISNTAPGTISDQAAKVGIGSRAIVVGNKLFLLPKYSLIDLGTNVTEDKDLTTKADLQPYGTDGTTQTSSGLVYDATENTIKAQNSWGHGALYYNSSEFNLTVTLINTYGRNLGGAAYGYHRYLFSWDDTEKAYIGKMYTSAGTVVLKPGDYLWCPMTAERFVTGLTDCDGTSGVAGVLSEGVKVQIIDTTPFAPAADVKWNSALFYNEGKLISQQYPESGQKVQLPTGLEKEGYGFVGWGLSATATEVENLTAEFAISANVVYYAIWEKLPDLDALTVDASYEGNDPNTFKTIKEALNRAAENAVITVLAGTYEDALTITKSVTILGPNAGIAGDGARVAEAAITGVITIVAGLTGVTINGFQISDDTKHTTEPFSSNNNRSKIVVHPGKNFSFINNYIIFSNGVTLAMGANEGTIIANNYFNWTTASGATGISYWRPLRFDGASKDFTFKENKVVQTVRNSSSSGFYDLLYFSSVTGTLNILDNDILCYGYNWLFNLVNCANATEINIKDNLMCGDATNTTIGMAISKIGVATNVNYIGNYLKRVDGTTLQITFNATDLATYTGKITIIHNKFTDSVFKPDVPAFAAACIDFQNNYIAATAVTAPGTPANKYVFTLTNNYATEEELDAYLATLS